MVQLPHYIRAIPELGPIICEGTKGFHEKNVRLQETPDIQYFAKYLQTYVHIMTKMVCCDSNHKKYYSKQHL